MQTRRILVALGMAGALFVSTSSAVAHATPPPPCVTCCPQNIIYKLPVPMAGPEYSGFHFDDSIGVEAFMLRAYDNQNKIWCKGIEGYGAFYLAQEGIDCVGGINVPQTGEAWLYNNTTNTQYDAPNLVINDCGQGWLRGGGTGIIAASGCYDVTAIFKNTDADPIATTEEECQ